MLDGMDKEKVMIGYLRFPLERIANSDKAGMQLMRVAIAIVFLWIGALKFAPMRPTASHRSSQTARSCHFFISIPISTRPTSRGKES